MEMNFGEKTTESKRIYLIRILNTQIRKGNKSMYAPLGYVEQIENYIYLPNTSEKFSREINDINNDVIKALLNNEEAMELFIDWYVLEAEKMQNNNGKCTKPCKPFIERVHFAYLNDFAESLTKAGYPLSWKDLKDGDSDLDFMNLVISKGSFPSSCNSFNLSLLICIR